MTDYQRIMPLREWNVVILEDGKKHVSGIPWWDDYGNLKHQTFRNFDLATLKNAVNSLASLMVLELYLMQSMLGTVTLANYTEYFRNAYSGPILMAKGDELPDFKLSK